MSGNRKSGARLKVGPVKNSALLRQVLSVDRPPVSREFYEIIRRFHRLPRPLKRAATPVIERMLQRMLRAGKLQPERYRAVRALLELQ